jgi:hypothetical protein
MHTCNTLLRVCKKSSRFHNIFIETYRGIASIPKPRRKAVPWWGYYVNTMG